MSAIDVYLGFCSAVFQVFNFIWLLAAWKAYSSKYFDYKLMLQSLSLTNFLFALVFNWLLDISILFPLPAFKVTGFLKYLPNSLTCRMLMISLLITTASAAALSVIEAVFVRILFVYRKHEWIKQYTRIWRTVVYSLAILVALLTGAAVCAFDMGDIDVLKKQNSTLNSTIDEDDDSVVYVMTITGEQWQDLVIYSGLLYIGVSTICILTCIMVYPTSIRRQNSLNNENVNHEKIFTFMLIIQCLMPALCLGAPFLSAVLSWNTKMSHSSNLHYLPTVTWIFYPMINSISSIYLLQPYRKYISILFGCTRRSHSVVPSIVVHGVDSACQNVPPNNPNSSVALPPIQLPQPNEEITELEAIYERPIRLPSISSVSQLDTDTTPRRRSVDMAIIHPRERRPSVFSRMSYFL